MASVTWNVSKDARVALNGSTSLGSGTSDGLPVGLYSGYLYRSLFGFSYSFSGMTAITSAILHIRTSSQIHVAFGSDPDIMVQRIVESWSEGSSNSLSGSNAVEWSNMPGRVSANEVQADITTAESTWELIDITGIINDAFNAGAFYGLSIRAVDESTSTDVTEFFSRQYSTSQDAYIVVTYSTNAAPFAPTGLAPTGDATVHSLTPTFTGSFSDPDAGDTTSGVQILVYADDGTTLIWDSGALTASGSSFSKNYAGTALTGNTFYKWKARMKDSAGAWGPYSVLQRFKVNSVPNAPSVALGQSPTTDISTLTPTFILTHSDPDASDSQMYAYQIILETGSGTSVWDSGQTTVTPTVSKTVTYSGPSLSWQSQYRWKARTQDSNGAWSNYSSYATFWTHETGVPTNLNPNNSEIADSTTPTLTGSRSTTTDTLVSAEIEVYASDGTTLVWSSGTFTLGVSSSAFTKVVGTTLTSNTTYKWRARVTGQIGGTSDWSSLQTMVTPDATAPTPTTPLGAGITDTTPDLTFTRTPTFNRHELDLYSEDDAYTTPIWSDAPIAYTATGSKAVTTGVTLEYGKSYKWRVRVSSDGGTNWSPYAGPVAFTMDLAGAPTLTAPIDAAWETSLTPTFTGNSYSAEVISTFHIYLYASDQTTLIWDSGDVAGSGTSFSKVYDGGTALTKGSVYFWQAKYTRSGGVIGALSALEDFHINADPTAPTNLSPATGTVVADDLTPDLKATFADADLTLYGDTPTNFEAEVYRNSDSVLMHSLSDSTGLVAGENTLTRVAEGTALSYEVEYKARFRYTDSKSAVGSWSAYVVFKPSQSPTTTITAPTATVSSPSFDITWTMSSPSSKAQGAYKVRVIRDSDSVTLYDTGKVAGTATSLTMPTGFLINGGNYTIEVTTWDSDDLPSAADTEAIAASWTPPDAPADFIAEQDNATSSVILTWTASNLAAADFSYYQIYRRVASDTDWTKYDTVTTQTVTTYTDFFAANDISYDYKMTTFQTVPGDVDLESSDSDIASIILDTDVWFVIGADRASAHCFELPVADESHAEPLQQEVFEPLGSSRKTVVRGKVLGSEGSMDVRWLDSEREAAKGYLAYLANNPGPHILKSPFGDVWEVEFGGTNSKYSGGGHMGVTLTWIEVD